MGQNGREYAKEILTPLHNYSGVTVIVLFSETVMYIELNKANQ